MVYLCCCSLALFGCGCWVVGLLAADWCGSKSMSCGAGGLVCDVWCLVWVAVFDWLADYRGVVLWLGCGLLFVTLVLCLVNSVV